MKKNIRIQNVTTWSIIVTITVAVIFVFVSIQSEKEFKILRNTTDQYILCEQSAKQLQDGSDYLTEQVRLYAMTGERGYMDLYFREADTTRRRENALESLKTYFHDTDAFASLQKAMDCSENLMYTEYYSMRLVSEAQDIPQALWPDEIKETELSDTDVQLTSEEQMQKAQQMVCDDEYQDMRTEITGDVSECMDSLIEQTRNKQGRATSIFSDMYLKLEIGIGLLVFLLLLLCAMVRRLVVKPLLNFEHNILHNEILPVEGSAELRHLSATYNQIYMENEETQKLIRHQAEHDALTGILNRGSFEKVLDIYNKGDSPFALLLIDVDVFKSVNDTYGHAVGDAILKKVADLLVKTFRSIDYVCRIGGDEFAIIMVEMTSNLKYTIEEKIDAVNEILAHPEDDLPVVSLSVGVAFSDRGNAEDEIFKDADKALYHVKENGRGGYHIF